MEDYPMYYAWMAFNDGRRPGQYWGGRSLACIDFCKGRKDGKRRLELLLERHGDLLPQTGWRDRILHYELATDDNRVIEELKRDIRLRCATLSITRYGERRKWARTPGAPAGFYRLDYHEANGILQDAIRHSGFYKTAYAA
jgi:hypothetical protein